MSNTYIPDAVGTYAKDVDSLMYILLAISAFFFVLVIGLTIFFIIRYRAGKQTGDGEHIHGNTKLEIIWTAIPTVIMVVLAVLSLNLIFEQNKPPVDSLIVKVTGYQFDWDFEYYESVPKGNGENIETVSFICGNPNVFVSIKKLGVKVTHDFKLPKGRPVRFLVTSKPGDVLHSFWVPEFRIKRDAVPSWVADAWTTPDTIGKYVVKCAELCGTDHSTMLGSVEVVTPQDFETWMSAQRIAATN